MTETTKAPSKEAIAAVRAVRCPHEPVNCDYCVAAALEAFAADMNDGDRTFKRLAQAERERDVLRARNVALVEALTTFLTVHPSKDDGPPGSEGVLISVPGETTAANPYRDEFAVLRAALAADAKAGDV